MNVERNTLRGGADLALVPRHVADAPELFALVDAHREVLREWLTWIDATRTLADARRYAHYSEAQFDGRVGFDYAVRRGGRAVGTIGLHAIDWTNRSAQIGYWLSPDARGAGTMTRACEILVAHAFGPLALHRLEIHAVVANARSRAVAERLGFAYEGTLAEAFVLHGVFADIALYAKIAPGGSLAR